MFLYRALINKRLVDILTLSTYLYLCTIKYIWMLVLVQAQKAIIKQSRTGLALIGVALSHIGYLIVVNVNL